MSSPPLHPIVIWFGRVGDMILLSALLGLLHQRYGSRCRVIGAGPWTAEIYRAHPDVEEVRCLRRHTPFLFDPAWWGTLRALRRARSEPVYVCETDPRKLARIRRLLALSGTDPARCVFITDDPESLNQSHWVDRLVKFGRLTPRALRAADYLASSGRASGAPLLAIAPSERADCDAWIFSQGWASRPIILVQPGNRRTMRGEKLRVSADDSKAWPIERWAELLHKVHDRVPDAVIVLCGAPRESVLLRWVNEATKLAAVFTAELPLSRLFALCESAHSMISVDTGPAHAAAALGLPLVVLFGAESQKEWLPRSSQRSPVLGIGGPPVSTRLDQISVDAVFESWCSLLDPLGASGRQQHLPPAIGDNR
jgi:heptosyltransferase-2/heptosyltransferase-3